MPFIRRMALACLAVTFAVGGSGCVCGLASEFDYPDSGARLDAGAVAVDAGAARDGGTGVVSHDGGSTEPSADAGSVLDGGSCPVVTCGSQCGPVRDFCNQTVLQCGACSGGKACDLVNHVCVTPEVDCPGLGAQCGQIRNTCGTRLNCGACSGNSECDRNTHTCVACSNATCQDLGYECGEAWLGCGPFSNTTNCGGCGTGKTCNTALHKCEPTCTPAADSVICAAAGAECGAIDNGCGGMATCGTCPTGTSCGARGIGNRCDLPEVPDECVAAYRNCGTMKTVCGPGTINCGTCPDGEICSVEGRCTGHPTCDAFGADGKPKSPCSNGPSASFPQDSSTNLACPCEAAGQCNLANTRVQAPAGVKGQCCENTVKCDPNECNTTKVNECTGEAIPCGCTGVGTKCNNSTKRCEVDNGCSSFTSGASGSACSNGPSTQFPTDAGVLTCPCSAAGAGCYANQMELPNGSMTAGTCCVPDQCPASSCGSIIDHCTGQTQSCSCGADSHCNTATATCVGNKTCSSYMAGGVGQVCSNGPAFSDEGVPPTLLTCNCTGGFPNTAVCSKNGAQVSGSTIGTCCQNSVKCGSQCNVTLTDECTGAPITCGTTCNGTGTCNSTTGPGTCIAYKTCAQQAPPADGSEGARCSTDANPIFSRFDGDPTGLQCGCGGGRVCSVSTPAPHVAGSGEIGACCTNTAVCAANTCGGFVVNTCTGEHINCGCDSSHHCVGGTCAVNKTCSDYSAGGAPGSKCSTGPDSAFPDGPNGADLTCLCSTGNGYANNTCSGATSTTAGTCGCTAKTPTTCGDDGQSDGCGGTMSMPCGGGTVCFQNACCTKQACGSRNNGDACGPTSTCGQTITCDCTQMYMTCGAVTPGVCGCKAKTLADCGITLPPGQSTADGCGGFVLCPG